MPVHLLANGFFFSPLIDAAKFLGLFVEGGGLVAQRFSFVPVRLGLGFGIFLELLEIDLPGLLGLHPGLETI
ncbi:MAG: hypothetical protein U5O69_03985 [Candidatus Competibacteraceae bacterium]|nr:hypothetical protein [Candidatus Competibacteraceae bacterium]